MGTPNLTGQNNRFENTHRVVREFLKGFKNKLVAGKLSTQMYKKEFHKEGDEISIKLPRRYDPVQGRSISKQPIITETIKIAVNKRYHQAIDCLIDDQTLSTDGFTAMKNEFIDPAAHGLADKFDRDVLETLMGANYCINNTGNQMDIMDVRNTRALQDELAVPMGARIGLIANNEFNSINQELQGIYNPEIVKSTIADYYMGKLSNYEIFTSINLPKHTVGNHGGTPVVNGANQTGSALVIDGATLSTVGYFKKGDIFSIDGIYSVNPVSKQSTGKLMQFVVTADTDSDGAGNVTVPISPSINDGTVTILDGEGNALSKSAYRNISGQIADGLALTIWGTAGKTYEQSFFYRKEALACVTVDLEEIRNCESARVRDPESGFSMLFTADGDINEMRNTQRIDILYGMKLVRPEYVVRLWGKQID